MVTARALGRISMTMAAALLLVAAFALVSCTKDGPVNPWHPDLAGRVTIAVQPTGLDAGWTLAGPDGWQDSGSGPAVYDALPAGQYTVTWAPRAGWSQPSPSSVTHDLPAKGVAQFSGTYTATASYGSLRVDPTPDSINAPWTASGPGGFVRSGNGDTTIEDLAVGEYTVTWGPVSGWEQPSPNTTTVTVTDGGVATAGGVYTEIVVTTGAIAIVVEPSSIGAGWSLSGPDGYATSGFGNQTLPGREAGSYTITWAAVDGWIRPSPNPDTRTLTAGTTLTFQGTYTATASYGSLRVDPTPDSINAPWTASGPGGFVRSGNGDTTIEDLAVGEYTVTWGPVSGWEQPSPNTTTVTVTDGGVATAGGVYTEIVVTTGAIAIVVEPSSIGAGWSLSGPDGYATSGFGNQTLPGREAGSYTITWAAVDGWIRPSPNPDTRTLTAGTTLTFQGTYTEDEAGGLYAAVAAGSMHSLALRSDGAIAAFGDNGDGACNVPSPNTGFIAVGAGDSHSLAIRSGGVVAAWGANWSGQCNVPTLNTGFTKVDGGYLHSVALRGDGVVFAWGGNAFGQSTVPSPNGGFVDVAAGYYQSYGVKSDGTVVGWGYSIQLPSPNSGFIAIAAGDSHVLGLKSTGAIVAWGSNGEGQCNVPSPNAGFVAVAARGDHSVALRSDGSVAVWGRGNEGQSIAPYPNSGFAGIATGGYHCLAVKENGTALGWGYNGDGQCNVP